MPYLH